MPRFDRFGPAVVLIDHVVKAKDERGRYALGSQHKMAGINGAARTRGCSSDVMSGRATKLMGASEEGLERSGQPVTRAPNAGRDGRKRLLRIVQIVVSAAIVVGVFAGVLPKITDYSAVWATIGSLTSFELATLCVATACHFAANWPQMVVSLPGLTLAQAAVNNQASSTVANALPGGGMIAVGVSYAMCRSWGFPDSAIALSTLITFVWNTFMKLALPVIALAILVLAGKGSSGLIVASLIGVSILVIAIGLLAMTHRKRAFAGQIGTVLGAVASFFRRLVHRPPVANWSDVAIRFRGEAIRLVAARWVPLTISTVVSHLGLYLVLMLAVRDVGVSAREVSWTQILGVFAFVRLLSALPITPGGLGIVDLGYIGGLVLAGRQHADVSVDAFSAQITAAVLVFRAFTYGLQIPLGGFAYLIWQRKKSWRRTSLHTPAEAARGTRRMSSGWTGR